MKNLKHLVGYIVAIALTFFVTNKFSDQTTTEHDCVIPKCDAECPPPSVVIPLDEVSQMYHSYKNLDEKVQRIKDTTVDPRTVRELKKMFLTEGIWFNYEDFKDYLAFIDRRAKDANITITGLRFFPSISKTNAKTGQMTLFFNPTIKTRNNEGEEGNFSYALKQDGEKLVPVLLQDVLPKAKIGAEHQKPQIIQEASLFSLFKPSSNLVYNDILSQSGNRGQVTPPPSDLE